MGIVPLNTQNKKVLHSSADQPQLRMHHPSLRAVSTALKPLCSQNNSQYHFCAELLTLGSCFALNKQMPLCHLLPSSTDNASVSPLQGNCCDFAEGGSCFPWSQQKAGHCRCLPLRQPLPFYKAEEFAWYLLTLQGKCAKNLTPTLHCWPTSHTSQQISSCLVMQSGRGPLSVCFA